MLWPLKSEVHGVRLVGANFDPATSAAAVLGGDDFSDESKLGGGVLSANTVEASVLPYFFIGNSRSTAGGVYCNGALDALTAINYWQSHTDAGSNSDIIHSILVLQRMKDVTDTNALPLSTVKGQKRGQQVCLFGAVSSAGAVSIGNGDFTTTKASTGVYTAVFRRGLWGQVPIVIARGIGSTAVHVAAVATTSGIAFYCLDRTGAATDSAFNFIVYGSSAKDSYGGQFADVQTSQRKSRLLMFRILPASATLAVGNQSGTVVVNGVGDYTITFRRPFRRSPVVLAASKRAAGGVRMAQANTLSSTTTQILHKDMTGAASDSFDALEVLVFGFDDPSGY